MGEFYHPGELSNSPPMLSVRSSFWTLRHAVYEPLSGPPWLDISPATQPPADRRLFLLDDDATYDFENEGLRRDNVRRALSSDPLVLEFFRLAEERNAILNAIPGVGMVSLAGDAAERFQRNQQRTASIQLQLAMKYTPQGAPCPCGSGQKFKRCHGQPRRNQQGPPPTVSWSGAS